MFRSQIRFLPNFGSIFEQCKIICFNLIYVFCKNPISISVFGFTIYMSQQFITQKRSEIREFCNQVYNQRTIQQTTQKIKDIFDMVNDCDISHIIAPNTVYHEYYNVIAKFRHWYTQKLIDFEYCTLFQNKHGFDDLQTVENEVKKFCDSSNLSKFDKVFFIKKLVISLLEYDYLGYDEKTNTWTDKFGYYIQNMPPRLILKRRLCVCTGYSSLTAHLLRTVGIEAKVTASRVLNHAWVAIWIDDEKYMIEPQNSRPIFYK